MSAVRSEIRPGAYADSIVLMQLQSALAGEPGVDDAGVVMGTPPNLELLRANDLFPESVAGAAADDLVVVVRAESDTAAAAALARIDALMARPAAEAAEDFRPASLRSAAKLLPDAGWVSISVPGRYAAGVAREALELGKHVFLYSDNVSLEDERALKDEAASRGLLVMGPDCGTAILNGVGLGFANRVRKGGVGLVGASGTGLQSITSRLHQLGAGVSHALGTGGRDLSEAIGGITALQGMDLLSRDPETKVIVLISKPPSGAVAGKLLAAARGTGKPVVVQFIGYPRPEGGADSLHFSGGVSETATIAASLLAAGAAGAVTEAGADRRPGYLRALFAGGTLALEAQQALWASIAPIHSNAPILSARPVEDSARSVGHAILDLGADEYTVGRLHPMMDQDLRLRRLRQEAADPEVGLILLDVILGEGSHPDPATELAPAIQEVRDVEGPEIVVLMVGTDEDPQDLADQTERLSAAGARVFDDVAEAFGYVGGRLAAAESGLDHPVSQDALTAPFGVLNVGLETFYSSVLEQGGSAVQLDWRPPAGGNEKLMSLLERLR